MFQELPPGRIHASNHYCPVNGNENDNPQRLPGRLMSPMDSKAAPANFKIIFALTLVHFTGDFYSAFMLPLLPRFMDKLALTLTQVGIITGMVRFLAFIVQPPVGYFADRYPTRAFFLAGLLLNIIFIPLAGIAPAYWVLVVMLALGSIGSSMFHPSVTGMVPVYGGKNTGFSMSVFNTGGTLAFAFGPLFISWYVTTFSLEAMPVTMVLGLAVTAVVWFMVPAPVSEGLKYAGFMGSIKETLGAVWKPLLLIWAAMVLRAVGSQAFLTFMPVLLAERGHGLISIGTTVSVFISAGTVSGLLAGYWSDKIGYKPIFYAAHGLMLPALLLFLHLPGNWVYLGAAVAGFFALATLPLGVVMAQELAPKGRSMVASLMMGFAYGLGGVFTMLVGWLADKYSLYPVLFCAAFIPLFTLLLIARFPDRERNGSPVS